MKNLKSMTKTTIQIGDARSQTFIPLLRYIAMAAAVFAMILCVLIIANFIQVKRADPLNTKTMKVLVDRMHADPSDAQLRQEIRELDLISRKAFFTNRWQVRMGGYLLFFSILVVIICLTSINLLQKSLPEPPAAGKTDFWTHRKVGRAWVAYTGISIVLISFIVVFFTHRELGKTLDEEMNGMQAMPTMTTMPAMQTMQGGKDADSAGENDTSARPVVVNMDGFPSAEEITNNFPSFRGPGGIGISWQKNIPTSWDGKSGKNIKWKTEIPLPGNNSPIIWNDRIFLTGANDSKREVYCIDLHSGVILWRKVVEKIPGNPSGEPKTIKETGYCASTMTTDGRRVYAIFANGDVTALDFDGNPVWTKSLGVPQNHYGHSSSLIMYNDLLIIQYDQRGSGSVMALAGKTGKTVWQTSRNVKVSWASPVIVNTGTRMELILAAEPVIAAYNPADGKELWRMECISGEVGPSVAYASGMVFAVNDFSKLSALKTGDPPSLLWEDSDYLSDIPSPVATGKYLFLVTSYGAVVCYDATSGTKYWEKELETPVFSSPMVAEGKVFLLDKKGVMHIFKADQNYTVIHESPLGEGSSCTPAFTDGKIIIRGEKNLYCVGK
jgi:outer membrane protein assembly factor BamB